MSAMQRFVDDDRGYLDWLAHHPDGFVVNTGRTPSAAYLMLHRAGCGTINGRPARGTTFTGDYAKVFGEQAELEGFARQLGGHVQPCGLCLAQPDQPLRPTLTTRTCLHPHDGPPSQQQKRISARRLAGQVRYWGKGWAVSPSPNSSSSKVARLV